MPIPVSPSDVQSGASRRGHQLLQDDADDVTRPNSPTGYDHLGANLDTEKGISNDHPHAHGHGMSAGYAHKDGALEGTDDAECIKNAYGDRAVLPGSDVVRRGKFRTAWDRGMAFLIKHGVESRGIEPVDERVSAGGLGSGVALGSGEAKVQSAIIGSCS